MNHFFSFLETKSLFYGDIDTTRMGRVWDKISSFFSIPPTIHLVGTNGKGTTGRFIATLLRKQGYRVGHYTSPHILTFHERIWIDGALVGDDALEEAHLFLERVLEPHDREALSYFEYTTLIAMVIFQPCDYVVLEAGLGGEFDATTPFPNKKLLVVTPVGKDHTDFLGESIAEIALTKLRAMQSLTLLGFQKSPEVYDIAQKVAMQRGLKVISIEDGCFSELYTRGRAWGAEQLIPDFLVQNVTTAMAALHLLGIACDLKGLEGIPLQGRCQRLSPHVVIDVGHNALAAQEVARQIPLLFETPPVLVYNCFKDKDPQTILPLFAPYVKAISIIPIANERVIDEVTLRRVIDTLGIKVIPFETWEKGCNLFVFGSFSVVEEFLKKGYDASEIL